MKTMLVASFVVTGALASACGGQNQQPSQTPGPTASATPPTPSETASNVTSTPPPAAKTLAEKMDDTTKALVDAWNAHDAGKISEQYATDAALWMPGMPEVKGRDAIKAQAQVGITAYPDLKLTPMREWEKGNTLVLEWVNTGTNNGDLAAPGMPAKKATHRPVGVKGISVLTFGDDGLVETDHTYYDMATELAQLDEKAKEGTFRPVASAPSVDLEKHKSTGAGDEQKNTDAVNALYQAIDDHKVDAFLGALTDDTTMDDMTSPALQKGKDAARQFATMLFKAVPDVKQQRTMQIASDDFVVTEGVMQGTLKGNFGPLKATNKPFALHYVDILQVKDGKIVRGWSYGNTVELTAPAAGK